MEARAGLRMVDEDDGGVDIAFRNDVLAGLAQQPKAIPARWFYDLRGSELFEEITQLPEYYPTRVETALLKEHGPRIARHAGPQRVVVEFGSGSSVKTPLLLDAVKPAAYVPIDISGEFLWQSSRELSAKFPELAVMPVEANFMRQVELPQATSGRQFLGFFPGSTIGNMVPRTAVDLLRSMRRTLGDSAQLLIGVDRIKDRETLICAYDDRQGTTARFNLNLLYRINRELGGDIPVDSFRHIARWNREWNRVEMHLEALEDVSFQVCDTNFFIRKGETIHTENSHKYTPDQAALMLQASGWSPLERWSDDAGYFMLLLAEATEPRAAP